MRCRFPSGRSLTKIQSLKSHHFGHVVRRALWSPVINYQMCHFFPPPGQPGLLFLRIANAGLCPSPLVLVHVTYDQKSAHYSAETARRTAREGLTAGDLFFPEYPFLR